MTLNSAYSHNACYVERDITAWYQDSSLWDRIAGTNGYDEMEGIFPGCYFDMSRNIAYTVTAYTGSKKIIIVGCNSYINIGNDNSLRPTYNHIVCCPYNDFGRSYMNSTPTTEGGFYNSFMNQEVLGPVTNVGDIGGTINQQLYAEFGDHLKTYKQQLTKSVNTNYDNMMHETLGASSGWTWYSVQSTLFSDVEVFGYTFSGSYRDIAAKRLHLPAFRLNPYLTSNRYNSWLCGVASATGFVSIHSEGLAYIASAEKEFCIKPSFVLA